MVINEEEDDDTNTEDEDDDTNTEDEDMSRQTGTFMFIDHDFEIIVTKSCWIEQLSLQSIFEFLS